MKFHLSQCVQFFLITKFFIALILEFQINFNFESMKLRPAKANRNLILREVIKLNF